ncbi:hypothetical protein SYJ56_19195 [Algoriphagus sp. D3-2-R+10]|uniref:hypothetical protein n=1 Tax=Algoriphagus aurantiacus TaxID=3103948 RepID=UPI002B3C1352|nr:hypothetical protein [Algoriphagus sp. D3-2-R+10]MEB2777449.1 hypothetical protein [Algoriphagus sp. D3-2-R+10]
MIFWKNRGLLILVYLGVSLLVTALMLGYLNRNYKDFFYWVNFNTSLVIGFWVAGIWTFLVRDDYYFNEWGEKIKMDTVNEFYFIRLEYWAYIFGTIGFIFLVLSIAGFI